jgi:peptidoglycan/xylan/chitin deacetylase (PgdA/CDA1 family)
VVKAAVSVDLDPAAGDAPWLHAVPRYLALFAKHDVRATFFVVARELERAIPRAAVREIAACGHELGNHTLDHPRGFSRLPDVEQRRQIGEADARLRDLGGRAVTGFRAPAWDIDGRALVALESLGYAYDSSVCPSVLAPAARAAGVRAFGDARVMFAPNRAYRPSATSPWRPGAMRLTEVPTSATPWRVPFWFSVVLIAGWRSIAAFDRANRGHPSPQWLFHAIDLLDFGAEAEPRLAWRRGLRRPIAEKTAMIDEILRRLTRGFAVGPVAELA